MEMLENRMRGRTKSLSNGNIHGYPGWIPRQTHAMENKQYTLQNPGDQ